MSYDWRPRELHIIVDDEYRIYSPDSDYHGMLVVVKGPGGLQQGRARVVAYIPEMKVETYVFEDELESV